MSGSIYMKKRWTSSAMVNMENDNTYCFIWSMLASPELCNSSHLNRVSDYRKCFIELNLQVFDFSKEFKCSDVHEFEKLNNLSINLFELGFYQDQNTSKHKLIPIETIKK